MMFGRPRFVNLPLLFVILVCFPAASLPASVTTSTVSPVLGFSLPVVAWQTPSAPAVEPTEINEQMRKSLDSMGNLPWYDADEGQLEPVPVKPRLDDSSNRDSRWVPKPPKPKTAKQQAKPTKNPNSNNQLPGFWSSLATIFGDFSNVIGWVLLGIVVAILVGLIVYTISKMEVTATGDSTSTQEEDEQQERAEQARLENLPMQVQRSTGDLLAEADRLRTAGRLEEAIIYLFGHRLIQLDRAHAIRLTRGKTNRQYLNELRKRQDLRAVLDPTVRIFEQSYFGRYSISSAEYDNVRSLQNSFEAALISQREAA